MELNKLICDAITNKDPSKLNDLYLTEETGCDKQKKITAYPLTQETISLIRTNIDFVLKHMHISSIVAIAIKYGIMELIDTLDQKPEYYEAQLEMPYDWHRYAIRIKHLAEDDVRGSPLTGDEMKRVAAVYAKAVNVTLQKFVIAHDAKRIANFSLRCTHIPRAFDEQEWSHGNYVQTKDATFDYSSGCGLVHNSSESFFTPETIKVMVDNIEFCMMSMELDTLGILIELSPDIKKVVTENKDALRKRRGGLLRFCPSYCSHLTRMVGEILIDLLRESIEKCDPTILGGDTLLIDIDKVKLTPEQKKLFKDNIGFIYLNFRRDIYEDLAYTHKIVTEAETIDGIKQYLATNPLKSRMRFDRLSDAKKLCASDKGMIAKIDEIIAAKEYIGTMCERLPIAVRDCDEKASTNEVDEILAQVSDDKLREILDSDDKYSGNVACRIFVYGSRGNVSRVLMRLSDDTVLWLLRDWSANLFHHEILRLLSNFSDNANICAELLDRMDHDDLITFLSSYVYWSSVCSMLLSHDDALSSAILSHVTDAELATLLDMRCEVATEDPGKYGKVFDRVIEEAKRRARNYTLSQGVVK